MTGADEIRRWWATPQLRGLWEQARKALETPGRPATFRLELPDDDTRQVVGDLYGRPMWGQGTRISVSKLDERVRQATGSGLGLEDVLEILHERPVTREESASTPARPPEHDPAAAALNAWNLDGAPWAAPWLEWLHQYGRVASDDFDIVVRRAAAVLAHLVLDPRSTPATWTSRADLARRFGNDPHLLDAGTTLTRVVLRAAAVAHGVDAPGNDRERRRLWERCGVTPEAVSATVLCWALPAAGNDRWSELVRRRTELGLPLHLTRMDLRAAPDEQLVEAGTAVAVCGNPRVLEAAVEAGIRHPLVCLSGHPTTTAVELLDRLTASGATLHHHAALDWSGITVANTVWADRGARLWRMSAADYRQAVNLASAQRIDLPTLVGSPVTTPWDPALSEVMATAGRAVDEENVLPDLLDDLRTGLP